MEVDPSPFYEQRVIVLMETKPQSNVYYQVLLDKEQFKGMSKNLGKPIFNPDGTALMSMLNTPCINIELEDKKPYTLDSEIKSMKI